MIFAYFIFNKRQMYLLIDLLPEEAQIVEQAYQNGKKRKFVQFLTQVDDKVSPVRVKLKTDEQVTALLEAINKFRDAD